MPWYPLSYPNFSGQIRIINNMEKKIDNHNNSLMDIFLKKCEENNLKVTPQRTAIYKELIKSKDHPSAEVIHKRLIKRFPNISLDTVNRTLLTFAKIGITYIVENSGNPKRFDPNINNHHHFVCLNCKTIIDFHSDFYDNMEIPNEIKEQATLITRKVVVLEGYCKNCGKKL